MVRIFPLILVLLWSSAFITTKPIIDNSDPFAALAFRFFFVAVGFLLFSIYLKQSILIKKRYLIESMLSGILFHGLYLGGVFYSISIGMPTSLAALIVTLQPILTNILSGPLLNEKVTLQQWVGVLLGFVGASLVLGIDVGSGIPLPGLIATLIALLSITFSTVNPKLDIHLPPGAEAPNLSIVMQIPSKPVYLCHPNECAASTTTLFLTLLGKTLSL